MEEFKAYNDRYVEGMSKVQFKPSTIVSFSDLYLLPEKVFENFLQLEARRIAVVKDTSKVYDDDELHTDKRRSMSLLR